MFIDETEKRYELKFTVSPFYLNELHIWVHSHKLAFKSAYPNRSINNIYFDTPNYDFYNDNKDGVSDRKKVRYRWYGNCYKNINGRLELKLRKNNLGTKRYCSIPVIPNIVEINYNHLVGICSASLKTQEHFFSHLVPTVINKYTRSYFSSRDNEFRITVDSSIYSYSQKGHLKPNLSIDPSHFKQVVVEIKTIAKNRETLSKLISKLPFRISRNSKYVNGFEKTKSIR